MPPANTALPEGTVTFLFTDIQGSTPLWEREPEKMAQALQIHNTTLKQAFEANGGAVFKTVGDAFQAAFPTAPQALKAAIEGQRALQSAPWNELGELKVRMGLHTGVAELDSGGDEYAVSHTKNRIGRIHSVAHGGQILISAETFQLVNHQLPPGVTLKELGEHHLKGLLYAERLYQVNAPGLHGDFPPLASESRPSHNLPLELTQFIGREKEITQVQELLRKHRLVTLTGSGGVGKTRLSIQAAGEMLGEFPHGIWYVELAPISEPDLVSQTVLSVLGLYNDPNRLPLDILCDFLKTRTLLLMLDNGEHLLGVCARLTDTLLHNAPNLKILVSSREALSIAGEQLYRVPSLTIPDSHQLPALDALQGYEAVQLFTERARNMLPSFKVTAHNAQAVVQICQRLDGIPLALELAAARLNLLTTEQLASRLDNSFRLLTGGSRTALPRQQTLRGAIDWSYNLLTETERLLLRRLAVFAGGAELEDIEAVCAGDGLKAEDILDLLSSLVSKSMVDAERKQGVEARYRLLETVRQYGREKLFDSGEGERLRGRHLAYYARLTTQAEPFFRRQGQIEWLERFVQELDNLRAALDWSLAEDVERGLQIMADLMWFWWIRGLFHEGAEWLDKLLKAESSGRGVTPLENGRALQRARGLRALSSLTHHIYYLSTEDRRAMSEESVAILRRLGPSVRRELGISIVFEILADHGNPLSAARFLEAQEIFQQENEQPFLDELLLYKAIWLWDRGHLDDSVACLKESLAICRAIEDFDGISSRTHNLGILSLFAGDYSKAEALFSEALEASRKVKNRWWEAAQYTGFLVSVLAQGRYEEALHLSQSALGRHQEMNFRLGIANIIVYQQIIAWAQADYARALRLAQAVMQDFPEIPGSQMFVRYYLGRVALDQGDLAQAEYWIGQAISLWTTRDLREGPFDFVYLLSGYAGLCSLAGYAALCARKGKLFHAATLMGAVDKSYRQNIQMTLPPRERDENAEALSTTRAAMGEEAFNAAWEEGKSMALEQALVYAKGLFRSE